MWTGEVNSDPQTADNWSNGGPASTDTVIIPADATVAIDGANDSAIGLAKMIIEPGCDINIGSDGDPWIIDIDSAPGILETSGEGSIWLQSDITLAQVRAAGSGAADGQYKLNLVSRTGTGIATTEITADSGASIGIAANAGEVSIVDTIRVHSGDVTIGSGVTPVDDADDDIILLVGGGDVVCHSSVEIVKMFGGELEMFALIDDLIETYGGVLYYRGTGTTAVATFIDGVLDCSRDMRARTFTTPVKYANAEIVDPYKTITFGSVANGLTLEGCDHSKIDRGQHYGVIYTDVPAD